MSRSTSLVTLKRLRGGRDSPPATSVRRRADLDFIETVNSPQVSTVFTTGVCRDEVIVKRIVNGSQPKKIHVRIDRAAKYFRTEFLNR